MSTPDRPPLRDLLDRLSTLHLATPATVPVVAPAGVPPAQPDAGSLIDGVRASLTDFDREARGVKQQLDAGAQVAPDTVGSALDKARSWVQYLAPGGPLSASFPTHLPTPVYLGLLTQVNGLQRLAQQWVDYFEPIWQRHSTMAASLANDERACLAQIAHAEAIVGQRRQSFYSNSATMGSAQMQMYVNQMNDLLAAFGTWRTAADDLRASGRAAPSQALDRLVARAQETLQMFQQSCHNRQRFEGSMGQPGPFAPPGVGYGGRPGPGSPEWYEGMMGMRCYWCGWDLGGRPVTTCPNCGRFPQPH